MTGFECPCNTRCAIALMCFPLYSDGGNMNTDRVRAAVAYLALWLFATLMAAAWFVNGRVFLV